MRNTFAIAKRELQAYFVSPIAYAVTAAFLLVMGILFALFIINPGGAEASMVFFFGSIFSVFFLLLITPLLTMRLLAEEQHSGTIELLLTSPVRDWEVVLGKFLASWMLFAAMLVLTLYYPFLLERFGNPDWGPIASGYLGFLLMGGALLSVGVLTSSLTQNQIVAAFLGVVINLLLLLCLFVSDFAGPLSGFVSYLSTLTHLIDLIKGVVDTKDVIYYLSVIAVCLFLATRSLETRRWR
ncbi:MAG: ABC transporter permease [Anaerolineae bacterium]